MFCKVRGLLWIKKNSMNVQRHRLRCTGDSERCLVSVGSIGVGK